MTVYEAIAALVQYGIDTGLTPECERIYTTNQLLEIMQLDDYEEPSGKKKQKKQKRKRTGKARAWLG